MLFAEQSSSPDSSFVVVGSRVWVWILVLTHVSLSMALNYHCFVLQMGRRYCVLCTARKSPERCCFWYGVAAIAPSCFPSWHFDASHNHSFLITNLSAVCFDLFQHFITLLVDIVAHYTDRKVPCSKNVWGIFSASFNGYILILFFFSSVCPLLPPLLNYS